MCCHADSEDTGVSGLRRGLATLPKVDSGAFSSLEWKTLKTTHWQCTASVCSGCALLGDLLGVSRSMERDLLSVLSIYPTIFLRVFILYFFLTLVY